MEVKFNYAHFNQFSEKPLLGALTNVQNGIPKFDLYRKYTTHLKLLENTTTYRRPFIIVDDPEDQSILCAEKVFLVSRHLYPLKRFLLCSVCGKDLTASAPKGKMGKSYESYHCHRHTKNTGGRVSVSMKQAHEQFIAQLERAEPAPWVPNLFREIVLLRWNTEFQDIQKRRHEIDDKIRDFEKKKNALLDLLVDESISVEAYQSKESQLSSEKSSLTLERDELKDVEKDKERIVDNAVEFLRGLHQTWSSLPFEHKQKFQSALLLDKITVNTNGNFGTPHFSPIIRQTTDIEKYISKNKIDLPIEKSIMAGARVWEYNFYR